LQRILVAVLLSVTMAATLVVSASASGASPASVHRVTPGSFHHQAAGTTARNKAVSSTKKKGNETAASDKGKNSENGQATLHYGPFASGSTDSGTCGPDWANDQFNRVFTVTTKTDGTVRVVEFFKNGSFVTIAGSSPGACENGPNNGGMVKAGIKGRFQGYFVIAVTGGTLNRSATCTLATCGTTAGFIKTVFGPAATFNVTTFLFNYHSKDKGLIQRHWTNASANRGGNRGDIRTS
jgi:hypothetical protein